MTLAATSLLGVEVGGGFVDEVYIGKGVPRVGGPRPAADRVTIEQRSSKSRRSSPGCRIELRLSEGVPSVGGPRPAAGSSYD